ncbi:MAG: hypothetical protein KKB82_03920 [Candidatus Omnitrophica bacterium]|nr:hypothetical protein [Candidatus Omnitrophota bacterium]MBU1925052.1 hypothetical protein [Candidatus Omnitrophota bacterium]
MKKLDSLTKDELISLYINDRKSLDDIAKIYDVSRAAVYKRPRKYNIKQRSKSEARIEAQKQGKLPQGFFDINENFFNSWSSEMAYVLGLIITDGCVSKAGVISLCINDKELLEKVKKTMNSEHQIKPSKHQKNLYYFHFARDRITKDLEKLGVVPRKSLTVKFPDIPQEYLSDFIRGVFDGDGSVFFDKRRPNFPLRSKFVSGSEDFIEGLHVSLKLLGMPERTVYKQKTKNGWNYMFIYDHKDSIKLFGILYKNIQNGLFLERKYKRFLEGF